MPWATWYENTATTTTTTTTIFASRFDGDANHWHQVGNLRVGVSSADPSLNVDPTRNGIEPDIAFTGPSDTLPWVVRYERGNGTMSSLHTNELVFAARRSPTPTRRRSAASTGSRSAPALQGTLDTTGANSFGSCAISAANEGQCSLNHDPNADAGDPQVAAGTITPGNPTVPWVAPDAARPRRGSRRTLRARAAARAGRCAPAPRLAPDAARPRRGSRLVSLLRVRRRRRRWDSARGSR